MLAAVPLFWEGLPHWSYCIIGKPMYRYDLKWESHPLLLMWWILIQIFKANVAFCVEYFLACKQITHCTHFTQWDIVKRTKTKKIEVAQRIVCSLCRVQATRPCALLLLYSDLGDKKMVLFQVLITKTHFDLVPPVFGSTVELYYSMHSRGKVLFCVNIVLHTWLPMHAFLQQALGHHWRWPVPPSYVFF